MNPFGMIEKLINEHGSSAILKERLGLIQDRFSERLTAGADRSTDKPLDKFVEYRGAKFRRKPSGGFEEAVYCPACETGMVEFHPHYVCARCSAASSFSKGQLKSVLEEVKKEYS